MTGWLIVIAANLLFAVCVGGLLRAALRPWNETDDVCAQVDEDLDARYGGWRN